MRTPSWRSPRRPARSPAIRGPRRTGVQLDHRVGEELLIILDHADAAAEMTAVVDADLALPEQPMPCR